MGLYTKGLEVADSVLDRIVNFWPISRHCQLPFDIEIAVFPFLFAASALIGLAHYDEVRMQRGLKG